MSRRYIVISRFHLRVETSEAFHSYNVFWLALTSAITHIDCYHTYIYIPNLLLYRERRQVVRGGSTVAYRFYRCMLLKYGLGCYTVTGHYQERQTASHCPFVVTLKPDIFRHALVLWGFPTTM